MPPLAGAFARLACTPIGGIGGQAEAFDWAIRLCCQSQRRLESSLLEAAAATRSAAASQLRAAHALHTAQIAQGKQLAQEVLVHEAFSLLALHGLNTAAMQADLARCTAALHG